LTAEDMARALFEAFHAADVARIERAIALDAVWKFPGHRNKLAGTHKGRHAIFTFLLNVQSLTGGTFRMERLAIAGSGDSCFVEFIGRAQRGDFELRNHTCLKLRFQDGLLVEAIEWVWDLEAVENFWS
jgi:uncharacterized protein